ncbi:hypothetical protein AB1Y20_011330 [Prymnesium parvum]|uniref:TIR domain-containing protein n=1 Tax=Prymnesium parvum TaxID=97485 RepID=A0AB34INZ3_PRYPA
MLFYYRPSSKLRVISLMLQRGAQVTPTPTFAEHEVLNVEGSFKRVQALWLRSAEETNDQDNVQTGEVSIKIVEEDDVSETETDSIPASPSGRSSMQERDVRITHLLTDSSSKKRKNKWVVGLDGKEYHYFLSHKKRHSRDGAVHAQIAANMVDGLHQLNFKAFFDIDTLAEISAAAIREGLEKSCALVVLLHNETHESDWCQLEWKIAEELNLPVCVIIDMERSSKAEELARAAAYPSFLQFQWIEYTGMRRREAMEELTLFLTKHTLHSGRAGDDDDAASQKSSEFADSSMFWYEKINILMVWGGLDMTRESHRKYQSRWTLLWYKMVRVSTYICVLTCLTRLVYGHGPAFMDHSSALATLLVHFHLLYAPLQVSKIMNSRLVRRVLTEVLRTGDLSDLYWISKILFYLGALLVPVALLLYVISWEPLFLSELYIGAERTAVEKAFGYGSGLLFLFGIFTHIPLLICVHIMSALVKLMSFVACESAADKLHPQIEALGLKRYLNLRRRAFRFKNVGSVADYEPQTSTLAESGGVCVNASATAIVVTDEAMVGFQEHWQMGWKVYEELNAALWPMQNVQLVWASTCLVVPLCLAIQSQLDPNFVIDRFPGAPPYIFWLNCLRLAWIWVQGPVFILIEFAFETLVTVRLRSVAGQISEIVFTKPTTRPVIDSIVKLKQPSRFSSLRIPATPCTLIALLLLFLASAVPWGFVRFEVNS